MYRPANPGIEQHSIALHLQLPDGPPPRPRPVLKPRPLEVWASQLAIGNTTVAAHQMSEKLRNISTARYSYKERLLLLNTVRPALTELLYALRMPLRQANLPLNRQHYQRSVLIQELLGLMAAGYKRVSQELSQQPRLREYEHFLITESIYLAIIYLGQQLLESYAIYAPESVGVWQDLNQLYRYAKAHHLELQQIDDSAPDTALPIQLNIDFAYKRCLMMALAEPFHLMQYEADDMYRLVASMVDGCNIEDFNDIVTRGEYIVDLNADQGPRFIESERSINFSDARLIDISAAKKQLNIHLQRLLANNAQHLIFESISLVERQQRDMLLRLADAWNGKLSRVIPRFALSAKVDVSTGLNASQHFIAEQVPFTPEMDELRIINKLDIRQRDNDISIASAYRKAIQKDRKHDSSSYLLHDWQQRNVSPLGIAICKSLNADSPEIRVGELITYRMQGKSPRRWQIGVVRWLKHEFADHEGMVHVGVLNLANAAVAVGCKALTGLGSGTDYFRSLLIPHQASLQQSRSLIVPALLYDVGTELTVNLKKQAFYARLTRMVRSTRSFTQFDFEVIRRPISFAL